MAGSKSAPDEPVGEGIGRIPGFVNSYTYVDGDETYLIDTGFSGRAKPIFKAFQSASVPLARVRKMLLTHHHLDHMGGAAYLLQTTQAPISCHRDDVAFVDGRAKTPLPFLMRLFVRIHHAPIATILTDGDRWVRWKSFMFPATRPERSSSTIPAERFSFPGDAVVERKGRLTFPAPRAASNLAQAVHSLGRLRQLDVETLLPGHGIPVTENISGLLDDLIRRAPSEFLAHARR